MSAMELSEWEGKLNEEVRIDCTLCGWRRKRERNTSR